MDQLIPVVGTVALLGSALVGGIFFAFSSFIMKALAGVPSAEGIGAMQSINVVVINPSFLSAFFGTAVLSFVAGGFACRAPFWTRRWVSRLASPPRTRGSQRHLPSRSRTRSMLARPWIGCAGIFICPRASCGITARTSWAMIGMTRAGAR